MRNPETAELRSKWVHFRIRDVHIPDPQALLIDLYGDDLLQGQVVDASDGGPGQGTFVVVRVDRIVQPVIVPVDRVLGIL